MNARTKTYVAVALLAASLAALAIAQDSQPASAPSAGVALPPPDTSGGMTLNQALATRRSIRAFSDQPLSVQQVSQLLWAGQGITEPNRGKRTAPSAGATYPLELYIAQPTGTAHYDAPNHRLESLGDQDIRKQISRQSTVAGAPLVIVIAADAKRTAKYGQRAQAFVLLEAGHVAQNILLEATALGLGAVPVGAFDPQQAKAALQLPDSLEVVYVIPVGHPRQAG